MEETTVYTEEEAAQAINALTTGIYPVAQRNIDELVKWVETLASTIDQVFNDKSFNVHDFDQLEGLWKQSWVVYGLVSEIEAEIKDLGLIGKVVVGIKGYSAISKLMKAIRQVTSTR